MAQCETLQSNKDRSLSLSLGQQPLPPTLPLAEGDAIISETLNWTSGLVSPERTSLNLYSQGTVYSLGQKRKVKLAFLIFLFGPPPGSIWACHTFQEGATAPAPAALDEPGWLLPPGLGKDRGCGVFSRAPVTSSSPLHH